LSRNCLKRQECLVCGADAVKRVFDSRSSIRAP
jgi:hypothetical protein